MEVEGGVGLLGSMVCNFSVTGSVAIEFWESVVCSATVASLTIASHSVWNMYTFIASHSVLDMHTFGDICWLGMSIAGIAVVGAINMD